MCIAHTQKFIFVSFQIGGFLACIASYICAQIIRRNLTRVFLESQKVVPILHSDRLQSLNLPGQFILS